MVIVGGNSRKMSDVLGGVESSAPWGGGNDTDSINGGDDYVNSSDDIDGSSESGLSAASSSMISSSYKDKKSATTTQSVASDSNGSSGNTNGAHDMVKHIFQTESKQLFYLRMIAAVALIMVTCIMSYFIFTVSRTSEIEQFETQYNDHAIKIVDNFESKLRSMIGSMDNFGVMSTSHSKLANTTWPFEIMPQFEIRGASTKSLSKSNLISFIPLVKGNDIRKEWEMFSVKNKQWVEDGLNREQAILQGTLHDLHDHSDENEGEDEEHEEHEGEDGHDDDHSDHNHIRRQLLQKESKRILQQQEVQNNIEPANFTSGISDKIFSFDSVDHTSIVDPYIGSSSSSNGDSSATTYFPIWQTTPVHEELVNYNIMTHPSFKPDINAIIKSQSIVFGQITDVSDIHDPFHFFYRPIIEDHEEDDDHEDDCTGEVEKEVDSHDGHDHLRRGLRRRQGRKLAVECHDDDSHDGGAHQDHEEEEDDHEEDDGHDGHNHRRHVLQRRQLEGHQAHVDARVDSHEEGHEEDHSDHEDDGHDDHGHDDHDDHDSHEDDEGDNHDDHVHSDGGHARAEGIHAYGYPFIMAFFPIFDEFDTPRNFVGMLAAGIYWERFFENALPPNAGPMIVVLENDCNQTFTYSLEGEEFHVVGLGDLHNTKYNHLVKSYAISELDNHESHDNDESSHDDEKEDVDDVEVLTYSGVGLDLDYCPYNIRIYPSTTMEDQYLTYQPILYTCMVVMVLVFTSGVFVFYDTVVERRQKKVANTAVKSTAVVNSLFPAQVRDRLLGEQETAVLGVSTPKNKLKSFLNEGGVTTNAAASGGGGGGTAPIADLFTDCTVLFADIAGFTAWSSVREPSQVFTLLESVYGAFDNIARKRKVFKVETIGDCYVAVTGLPEPQEDHALILCSFASECLNVMNHLVKDMEVTLGPDTGDLSMRFGIHSGQVTAGVLRGEKSRFQLFGDTVNTASRMESTGMPGRIQCSEMTRDLLVKASKSHWLTRRDDEVQAKGKGTLQTFWVAPKSNSSSATGSSTVDSVEQELMSTRILPEGYKEAPKRIKKKRVKKSSAIALEDAEAHSERLVGWAADVLQKLLLRVVRERLLLGDAVNGSEGLDVNSILHEAGESNPIYEVCETIPMSRFDSDQAKRRVNMKGNVELDPAAASQLKDYVAKIASMYRENPFHNFDHAAHVTQSASKLLNRIKTADHLVDKPEGADDAGEGIHGVESMASSLHTYTFGITSDPMAQFAIVFAALIHDVDHAGVSNATLIKEGIDIAQLYKEKSVAEQNSIDVAWELLMEDNYLDLQKAIFTTKDEYDRFRKLVVNSVIATDIFDKDLKALRNNRWDKAFQADSNNSADIQHDMDIKATIVLEHLIQASDVAHCMQHWKVYQKWNSKLFEEMYVAFVNGRSDSSPEGGWVKGEIWFFDNYIIPLAKKLDQCQVFGVSSHEYLDYARQNRKEWETKGESQVEQWMVRLREQYPVANSL